MSNNLKVDKAPSSLVPLLHARLHTPIMWGPLSSDNLVAGKSYKLDMSELGVIMTLTDGTQAIIPMTNVRLAVIKK